MGSDSTRFATALILVTIVYGLMIVAAALRIRKSLRALWMSGKADEGRFVRKLDVVFSTIVLVATIVFYGVFIANLGR